MEIFLSQLSALIAFFAFPAIRYFFLKRNARKEGLPELWYLPKYGFRLVIRNLPRKRCLSDIQYKAYLREIKASSSGSSVATFNDKRLVEQRDFFLFPCTDHILISFKIEKDNFGKYFIIVTDKVGNEVDRESFDKFSILVADYTAILENWFNFDIKLAKRVELSANSLQQIFESVQKNNQEQHFLVERVRNVG